MKKRYQNVNDAAPVCVLHLTDRLHGGGVEKWLWEIVRLTQPDKVKHFVITFSPDKGNWVYADLLREKGAYRQFPKQRSLQTDHKSKVALAKSLRPIIGHTLRGKVRFLIRCLRALWSILRSSIWFRPDIIHVHGKYIFPIGLLAKVVLRCPLVHSVPCLFSQMVDQGKTWLPKFYTRLHPLVDCFFAGPSREELRTIGIPDSKIFPIRGAIDLQAFQTVWQKRSKHYKVIQESLFLPSDCCMALSVGRLTPIKGHHFALEALPFLVDKFPHLHWVVLGEGKQRAELEERAKALGVSRHVHLLGFQDNPLPYYAAATVYFRTGILEGENLSSLQAMAMGLAVVGFDTSCEMDLITKVGHGILVPNQNVEALAAAAEQILTLPDQGREMGSRGMEYIRVNLDIRNAIADFTTIYQNLKNGLEVRSEQFLSK